MNSTEDDVTSYRAEVASMMGMVPNFFAPIDGASDVVRSIWEFARASYLGSPIPSPLKDRLFIYLSRFCEVRYCIARHCAFLLAGDEPDKEGRIASLIRLLRLTPPWDRDFETVVGALSGSAPLQDWPEPGSQGEELIIAAATAVFIEPRQSEAARGALLLALGPRRFQQLMLFVTFVRTAHFWTMVHPELKFEDDVLSLLASHEELAGLILDDSEAGRLDMGVRLFEELTELRDLHERRDLELAKQALEVELRSKEQLLRELRNADEQRLVMMQELSHRVKNTFAMVQAIVGQTLKDGDLDTTARLQNRLLALSAAHDVLLQSEWSTMSMSDLVSRVLRLEMEGDRFSVAGPDLEIGPKAALSLSMLLHELGTNAIKYGALTNEHGVVHVSWRMQGSQFHLEWDECGGPPAVAPTKRGFGTRLISMGINGSGHADLRYTTEGLKAAFTAPQDLVRA